ncbi:MAG: hypothetical protein WKF58_13155 [Ilumatobacteraceae bacterium]
MRATLDHATVGHRRAEGGERDHIVGRHVERAAPDVTFTPVAGVDPHALHGTGIGMSLETHDASGHDAGHRGADVVDVRDLEPDARQRRGDRVGVVAGGHVLVQPRQQDLHTVSIPPARFIRTARRSGCRR